MTIRTIRAGDHMIDTLPLRRHIVVTTRAATQGLRVIHCEMGLPHTGGVTRSAGIRGLYMRDGFSGGIGRVVTRHAITYRLSMIDCQS